MPGKRKRQAYDNAFKIRVIEFADNLNINSAAEGEFGISEKLVHDRLRHVQWIEYYRNFMFIYNGVRLWNS